MKTYAVQAQRAGSWWVLTSQDAPGAVSQVRSLSQAAQASREAIAFVQSIPEGSFHVAITPMLPPEQRLELEQARAAVVAAEEALADAAERARQVVRGVAELYSLSGTDLAVVLNVSKQRVSQLLRGGGKATRVTAAIPVAPRGKPANARRSP